MLNTSVYIKALCNAMYTCALTVGLYMPKRIHSTLLIHSTLFIYRHIDRLVETKRCCCFFKCCNVIKIISKYSNHVCLYNRRPNRTIFCCGGLAAQSTLNVVLSSLSIKLTIISIHRSPLIRGHLADYICTINNRRHKNIYIIIYPNKLAVANTATGSTPDFYRVDL